jgi:hypothetical protein
LQINFPQHQQQQFDTQRSRQLEEPSAPTVGRFIDPVTGNLCLEQLDEAVKESISRHGTREKTRSSQKRRKKKKAKKRQLKKELGK